METAFINNKKIQARVLPRFFFVKIKNCRISVLFLQRPKNNFFANTYRFHPLNYRTRRILPNYSNGGTVYLIKFSLQISGDNRSYSVSGLEDRTMTLPMSVLMHSRVAASLQTYRYRTALQASDRMRSTVGTILQVSFSMARNCKNNFLKRRHKRFCRLIHRRKFFRR